MPLYSGASGRGGHLQCRRQNRPDWSRPLRPLGGALPCETALIGHGHCAHRARPLWQAPPPLHWWGGSEACRTVRGACEYYVRAVGSHVAPCRASGRRRPHAGGCPSPWGRSGTRPEKIRAPRARGVTWRTPRGVVGKACTFVHTRRLGPFLPEYTAEFQRRLRRRDPQPG